MEQFNHHILHSESQPEPTGIVAFDVLRTLIAARQSESPTVRALATLDAHQQPQPTGAADSLISLFAHGTAADARLGAFHSGEPVIRQDERHA